MKRTVLDVFALVVAMSVAVVFLDRQIRFAMAPCLILINVMPAVLFAGALYGLTARAVFAFVATLVVQTFVIVADVEKNKILHSHLSYADLKLAPMFLHHPQLIVGFVASGGLILVGTAIVLLLLIGAWPLRRTHAPPLARAGIAGFSALLLAAVVANATLIPLPDWDWNPFEQTEEAPYFGVTANLLFGARETVNVLVRSDPALVQRFHEDPWVKSAIAAIHAPSGLRPDIVIVQSESLFEPSALCGLPDAPILPTIAGSNPSVFHVPVFGGRTLQTEFEVLSGAPTRFFLGNQFAYFDLLKGPIPGLPFALSGLGYRTIAIHPGDRDFWRRSFALPALGFEHFIDNSAFSDRDMGMAGHVSDSAMTTAVLSELSATNQPTMVFVITMQNHGPWGASTPGKDPSDRELTDYIRRARAADAAWKDLIDGLAKRGKPTIALIYGDHMPGLTATYEKRCFKDGKNATDHWPPLAMWSNFDVPPLPHDMSSYLVPGWVMEAAQLPMTPYFQANAAARHAMISTPDESTRLMLFNEYGNIAGKMLVTGRTPRKPKALLDQDQIGHRLNSLIGTGKVNPSVAQDILLDSSSAGNMAMLNLHGNVESITFRPYAIDRSCKGEQSITYSSSDRLLAKGSIGRGADITTVPVSGVDRLIIKRDRQDSEEKCWPVTLRLVQMECKALGCGVRR